MSKNRKAEVEAAQKTLDLKNKKYQLELDTSAGKILLDMAADVAPGHVANLLGLAKIGYYDGLVFHRIIKGFMIQGGCPEGTGTGGPGYTIKAEFNKTRHEPGVVSMARTQRPQFRRLAVFHLPGGRTAFGRSVHGVRQNGGCGEPESGASHRHRGHRSLRPAAQACDD